MFVFVFEFLCGEGFGYVYGDSSGEIVGDGEK